MFFKKVKEISTYKQTKKQPPHLIGLCPNKAKWLLCHYSHMYLIYIVMGGEENHST